MEVKAARSGNDPSEQAFVYLVVNIEHTRFKIGGSNPQSVVRNALQCWHVNAIISLERMCYDNGGGHV